MAKRRDPGMAVNLFPFLSVLVSIIGCLTLIIVVINVDQMDKAKDGQTDEELERAEEWKELKEEQEQKREEIEKLKTEVADNLEENRDTIAKREKLRMLKSTLKNKDEIEETLDKLIEEHNKLTRSEKDLDKQHPEILEEIRKVEAEIAKLDLDPDPPKLRISPTGSGIGLTSRFIEATGNGLYYHHSLTEDPLPIAGGNALATDEVFQNVLKDVGSKATYRLIFLVRGDSTKVVAAAQKQIDNFNDRYRDRSGFYPITPGKMPLLSKGKVDLSPFRASFAK